MSLDLRAVRAAVQRPTLVAGALHAATAIEPDDVVDALARALACQRETAARLALAFAPSPSPSREAREAWVREVAAKLGVDPDRMRVLAAILAPADVPDRALAATAAGAVDTGVAPRAGATVWADLAVPGQPADRHWLRYEWSVSAPEASVLAGLAGAA